jgi:hypothetical protein
MVVTQKAIDHFKALQKRTNPNDIPPLPGINTRVELIAYVIECARAEGKDECDWVELLHHDTDRATLRGFAKTMRRLGYIKVADRPSDMAKRRCKAKP